MTPNHDSAHRHACDVASDTTHTPAARNLARAYLDLLERMHRAAERGERAIAAVETALVREELAG